MPSLTWKLIALLTLIFGVAVFLWFIFLGPLSRCDRLTHDLARANVAGGPRDRTPGTAMILALMAREGCTKGTGYTRG